MSALSVPSLADPCHYHGDVFTQQQSKTAKLRIWTLLIWCISGPGFRSARQVLCEDASRLLLDHFSKHLSSVLGRTELCHEVWNPRPEKPKSSATKTTMWHCSKQFFQPLFALKRMVIWRGDRCPRDSVLDCLH